MKFMSKWRRLQISMLNILAILIRKHLRLCTYFQFCCNNKMVKINILILHISTWLDYAIGLFKKTLAFFEQLSTNTLTDIKTPYIEKNNSNRTTQAESSKFALLLFDQGFQIVIPPRIVANVPEPIRTPSDSILHWSICCLFHQSLQNDSALFYCV